ncbi:helix-turn-helix domain-containing protein [Hutsoniella sourekii]|uniref:hypothetical protein n=1 Tax=Hutsoniella sourekii TaxID=87650 RepID=UPI0004802B4E|nr:hypothetical protein [Hutsoniella sourekii]
MKEYIKMIEKLIFDSDITTYRIAKETGIATQVLDRYKNGGSKIENMSLKNASKLVDFYKEYVEPGQ